MTEANFLLINNAYNDLLRTISFYKEQLDILFKQINVLVDYEPYLKEISHVHIKCQEHQKAINELEYIIYLNLTDARMRLSEKNINQDKSSLTLFYALKAKALQEKQLIDRLLKIFYKMLPTVQAA